MHIPAQVKAAVIGSVLIAVLVPAAPAVAEPNGYVTMSDGIEIAINLRMPDGWEEGDPAVPTVFEMSGYDGGSADGDTPANYGGEGSRGLTKMFNGEYATLHASVRGTGCSGGEFDLFSWRSALDGREIVEWIADQPWSDGKVAIYGHSYGGITGFMVTATRPPHLTVASLSGLIDDLYRGIVYPGGVSNYGFPLLWTGAIRPVYDVGGGTWEGIEAGDEQCAENLSTRSRTVLNDPIVQGLQDTDNTWFQARSLINYAERIRVPIHISGAFQDEQTGPRGPYHLFEAVTDSPARHLLMGNGNHGTQTSAAMERERKAFVDHFMLGHGKIGNGNGIPATRVTTFLEQVDNKPTEVLVNETFPLENTEWTDYFLHADGKLGPQAPGPDEGSDSYVSGSPRQAWFYETGYDAGPPVTTQDANGQDELIYSTGEFEEPTAIVGPATATLFVSSTAPDTELFVQIIDEAPDGSRYYIQRGMLKASHRAIQEGLSDKLADGTVYRPHRPHTNPTLITPGETYKYLIEIFPFGHVFRPGHKLIVKIHTPPIADSYYAYVPKRPAGINTVLHAAESPSRLMLPVIPLDGVDLGAAPGSCSLTAVRCI